MAERVLIIDDSLTVRMDLGEAFEHSGYPTELCASLGEANRYLAETLPDAIVLDVVLPDGDGVAFLGALKAAPRTAHLPVVLLSSEAAVADRVRGLSQGADAYVGKPYDRDYLTARVSDLLRADTARVATTSVLVIDDSPTYRDALASLLAAAGYRVIVASSGAEGLRRAVATRPDAIVVDGVMPGLDGPAVVRSVRLDPGLAATPCLFLTASEGALLEVEALDAGADAYARKSDAPEMVLARLAAMLRSARESRRRESGPTLLGPKRVLAVHDDAHELGRLGEELRAAGVEVVLARSGEEALQLLTLESFDCVLVAEVIAGGERLSGSDTCRRIKGSALLRRVPLILLGPSDDEAALLAAVDAGADDHVGWPGDLAVLRARLRAQLRRKQFEDEHRRVRDALMCKEAEVEAARQTAEMRREMAEALSRTNVQLRIHTQQLERLNSELQTFAYSVSHDLRQPLRSMHGFAKILLEDYRDALDDQARHYLDRIGAGAQRMSELIDGLLELSRITTAQLSRMPLHLDRIAHRILDRLAEGDPRRIIERRVEADVIADVDPKLIDSLFENLLGNAWKFTSRQPRARIEVGTRDSDGERVFFVKDDGVGFDATYQARLFGPFQRLHNVDEFEGNGIGLATAQRIVHRHGGRIWAESTLGQGATFLFTLTPGT